LRPGAAPASLAAADISASPPDIGLPSFLVTEDPREVCPLSGGMLLSGPSSARPLPVAWAALKSNAIPILPITDRHSLPPSSLSRYPVGRSCERLSPRHWQWRREDNGVTSFTEKIVGGEVVPLDRWRDIRGGETLKSPHLATYLLVPACQQLMRPFWLVEHHGLYNTSPELTVPQICTAPDHLALLAVAVSAHALTTGKKLSEVTVVPQASHPTVTSRARCGSRLLTEQ